jgi:hypothetical protein
MMDKCIVNAWQILYDTLMLQTHTLILMIHLISKQHYVSYCFCSQSDTLYF